LAGQLRRDALVKRAAGLFRWASTACDFIEDSESDGPEAQLSFDSRLMFSVPSSGLHHRGRLWTVSISKFSSKQSLLRHLILASIMFARSWEAIVTVSGSLSAPLLVRCLASTRCPISPLVSFVRGTDFGKPPFHTGRSDRRRRSFCESYHPSFVDFITDRSRCANTRFHIDEEVQHSHLAIQCLLHMKRCLKRDICENWSHAQG